MSDIDLRGWRDADKKHQLQQARNIVAHAEKVVDAYTKDVLYSDLAVARTYRDVISLIGHDTNRAINNLRYSIGHEQMASLWHGMMTVLQWSNVMEFILALINREGGAE